MFDDVRQWKKDRQIAKNKRALELHY